MKKAIGYIRVSTTEQATQGLSLDNQAAKIQLQAELAEYHLSEIIGDPGYSAKDLKRPGIKKVLSMVKARAVEAVIIYRLDRLSRSVRDLDRVVRACNKVGIALISVKENIDTETAGGRMVLNILGCISQWEREAIGERTAEALQRKREQGEKTGGTVPYGYDLAPDGVHLVKNPKEQKAIALMANLRAKGYTYQAIADELKARSYKTKSGRDTWSVKVVSSILRRKKAA